VQPSQKVVGGSCYLKGKSMPQVKSGVFKGMFSPIVREVFDLGHRNNIVDPATKHQTAGWKGILTLDLEDDLVAK
jgi:hypothetical protein